MSSKDLGLVASSIISFFDQIDHDWMMRFMEHRIADKRVLRLIRKWLKVGVLDEDGNRMPSDRGAAQGAVISPLLANVYLHYVLDLWSLSWRKGRAQVVWFFTGHRRGAQSPPAAPAIAKAIGRGTHRRIRGAALGWDKT